LGLLSLSFAVDCALKTLLDYFFVLSLQFCLHKLFECSQDWIWRDKFKVNKSLNFGERLLLPIRVRHIIILHCISSILLFWNLLLAWKHRVLRSFVTGLRSLFCLFWRQLAALVDPTRLNHWLLWIFRVKPCRSYVVSGHNRMNRCCRWHAQDDWLHQARGPIAKCHVLDNFFWFLNFHLDHKLFEDMVKIFRILIVNFFIVF